MYVAIYIMVAPGIVWQSAIPSLKSCLVSHCRFPTHSCRR